MTTPESQLFEDTFTVTLVNAAKYDRVSRISGHNLAHDTQFSLDINSELYPVGMNETFSLMLSTSLALDGSKEETKGWRETARGEATLADLYDYVCHGKIYRFEEADAENIKVFVSFGGLLLYMIGPYKKLTSLRHDHVYMLIKK